jgi:four helix bundle protein
MKKENVIREKSYAFAVKIVNVCRIIQREQSEYVLSKQLLRSGTAIGANIEEAIGGYSRKDFHSKLSISYKEARETKYWIRLLTDASILNPAKAQPLLQDINELLRILASIQITLNKPT